MPRRSCPGVSASTAGVLFLLLVSSVRAADAPVRKLRDGSTLRLLGVTYGQRHDLVEQGGSFGPDITPPGRGRLVMGEDQDRLGVWLRRDGGTPGETWAPWVGVKDEHGCRFPALRWPVTTLPNPAPREIDGMPLEPSTQVRFATRKVGSQGQFGTGLPGPPDALVYAATLDAFPRHSPWVRVWTFDADGTRHEFETGTPHRPLPQDWAPAIPAEQKEPGLSVTMERLTTGLSWQSVQQSEARGLPAWHRPPARLLEPAAPDGEEMIPWAQVHLKAAGTAVAKWLPDAVQVEDRWGNSVLQRPVYWSERAADGRMWIAFPSPLCEREPAWKVTLLFQRAQADPGEKPDLEWKHEGVSVPGPGERVDLPSGDYRSGGLTLRSKGLSGRGPLSSPSRVGLTAIIPPGETIFPSLKAVDAQGRTVEAQMYFRTVSLPQREYSFSLEPAPGTTKLNLIFGIWRNRRFSALLKPQPAEAALRHSEAAEREHAVREERELRHATLLSGAMRRRADRSELVARLVREGLDPSRPFRASQRTPLTMAVEAGDAELVAALLKAGADPNRNSYLNVPPLMTAAHGNSVEIVTALLQAGAQVNGVAGESTPLMAAAANARVGVVEALLKAGADVNRRSGGETALMVARRREGQLEGKTVIRLLLQAGAKE